MYYEGELTREQMQEYNHNKLHDFWDPTAIDNDPYLTESQKEQMKDYNRVWGDGDSIYDGGC